MAMMQRPFRRAPWLLLPRHKRGRSVSVQCKIASSSLPYARDPIGAGQNRDRPMPPRLRRYSSGGGVGSTGDGDSNGMQIYDSLSSSYRALPPYPSTACGTMSDDNGDAPPRPRGTAWYVCGPTVYDSAHLGHGRTYVAIDVLRRVALREHDATPGGGRPRPLYVMNVTDVDDKIIKRSMENKSNERGEADPLSLARKYEREFWEDMDALNVMRPDVVCRVSEHVEATIVPYIRQIVEGGMAYVIPEEPCVDDIEDEQGSVYFDVRAFEAITDGRTKYGKLAPDVASTDFFSWESNNEDDEGEPIRTKRDPRDFCLWKYRPRSLGPETKATIIEPSSVSYPSPWGPGRPGWHVECSAMIQRLSRDFRSTHAFDMHAGGVDLKFPHHSNEIAQAEAYAACSYDDADIGGDESRSREEFREWIPHWVHTGHLYVKGRKMSKSLKNFVTIREMLGASAFDRDADAWTSPADDFRLWVLGLSGAYRGPATYAEERMEEARAIRGKWVRFLMEGQECLDRWDAGMMDDDVYRGDDDGSSRLWGEEELELFRTVTQCSVNCRVALTDDLDGTSFVKELTRIVEAGLAYVQLVTTEHDQNKKQKPQEPLRLVLDTFRGQLDLVGFTRRTVNAGILDRQMSSGQHGPGAAPASSTNTAILDEAVAFRSAVRAAALGAVRKKKDGLDAAKDILKLCDEMRDDTFPKLGVEILDGKVVDEVANAEGNAGRGWRHCPPRERLPSSAVKS